MGNTYETYRPDYYYQFKEIEKASYRDIIHFYELHESQFNRLDFHKRVDIKIAYCCALFEIGKYSEFLYHIDDLIETVIYHNVFTYKGKDIYRELLFKKAAALYQTGNVPGAESILFQLILMDPENKTVIYLRKKCQLTHTSSFYRSMKGVSILLFLFSAIIAAFEILLITPFYAEWEHEVEILRNLFFIGGIGVLGSGALIHRFRSFQQVNKEVEKMKSEKRSGVNHLDKKMLKIHSYQ